MTDAPLFPFTIDAAMGRAHVRLTGTLCAERVGRTFVAITLEPAWYGGEKSVVRHLTDSRIPGTFEFGAVMRNALEVRSLTRPGRSAGAVEQDTPMGWAVAEFCRNPDESLTDRRLRVWDSLAEAEACLNS